MSKKNSQNPQDTAAEAVVSTPFSEMTPEQLIALIGELEAKQEELNTAITAKDGKISELSTLLAETSAALVSKQNELEDYNLTIQQQHEIIVAYEAEKEALANRIEKQDERIEKALAVMSVKGKKIRPLKKIARVVGRLIIFAEQLRGKRSDAVMFTDLSPEMQEKVMAAAPHIFKEVADENNSITA